MWVSGSLIRSSTWRSSSVSAPCISSSICLCSSLERSRTMRGSFCQALPIGNAWQKLPRIVRDLTSELHKQIELEMHGADTELDRQGPDLIKDPLTHQVSNP